VGFARTPHRLACKVKESRLMKTSIMAIAALALLQVTGVACQPGYRDRRTIGERQESQRERIREGVDEGDLTRREAERLRERSRDIADDRRDARADDGRIDPKERRKIRHKQNRLSDQIRDERHDDQSR